MSPFFSRSRAVLAGFFALITATLWGAEPNDEWLAQTWQTEEGLSDNSVGGLAQTADGYLWVGTPTGLARLDGLRFENIALTNVIALPNHGVVTMLRGRKNTLWLAMDRGAVVRLSGKSSRAFVDGLPNFIPNGIAEDGEGALWIAYRGGTVYRIKDDQVESMTTGAGLPTGVDICALTTDVDGRLWCAKAGRAGVCSNGTLVGWGYDGASSSELVPTNLAGVTMIASGYESNIALLTNGTVTAWGNSAKLLQSPERG